MLALGFSRTFEKEIVYLYKLSWTRTRTSSINSEQGKVIQGVVRTTLNTPSQPASPLPNKPVRRLHHRSQNSTIAFGFEGNTICKGFKRQKWRHSCYFHAQKLQAKVHVVTTTCPNYPFLTDLPCWPWGGIQAYTQCHPRECSYKLSQTPGEVYAWLCDKWHQLSFCRKESSWPTSKKDTDLGSCVSSEMSACFHRCQLPSRFLLLCSFHSWPLSLKSSSFPIRNKDCRLFKFCF